MDEELYPEAYRKSEYIKGSNDQVPEVLRIARIEEIYVKDTGSKLPNLDEIKIRVKKFYRSVYSGVSISLVVQRYYSTLRGQKYFNIALVLQDE